MLTLKLKRSKVLKLEEVVRFSVLEVQEYDVYEK